MDISAGKHMHFLVADFTYAYYVAFHLLYNRVAMFWVELKRTLQTTEAEPKLEQIKNLI